METPQRDQEEIQTFRNLQKENNHLKAENAQLKAINNALIKRSESDMSNNASPFSYFYRTVIMEKMVLQKSQELLDANQELTTINAQLLKSRKELTEEVQRRKSSEEKLQIEKENAENADRNKTRFLAAATHDLLQPLNSARLFLYSLKQANKKTDTSQIIVNTEKSIELAGNLIKTLLNFSKIDSGMIEPQISQFPLSSLLENLQNEFKIEMEMKGLNFQICPCSFWIKSDPVYFHRILQNFVSNAVRYTKTGKIIIQYKRTKEFLKIQVIDTGVGIKQDSLSKIFDEFYRENESDVFDSSYTGDKFNTNMGLGLSIAKRFAFLLKMELEVVSNLGKGSSFSLLIPWKYVIKNKKQTKNTQSTPPKQKLPLKIVCYENDPIALEQLATILKSWSFEVKEYANFYKNQSNFNQDSFKPDLIIADYHLSQFWNGLEIIQTVRQFFNQKIPAILISADFPQEKKAEINKLEIKVLEKPLDLDFLHKILHELKQQELLKT